MQKSLWELEDAWPSGWTSEAGSEMQIALALSLQLHKSCWAAWVLNCLLRPFFHKEAVFRELQSFLQLDTALLEVCPTARWSYNRPEVECLCKWLHVWSGNWPVVLPQHWEEWDKRWGALNSRGKAEALGVISWDGREIMFLVSTKQNSVISGVKLSMFWVKLCQLFQVIDITLFISQLNVTPVSVKR